MRILYFCAASLLLTTASYAQNMGNPADKQKQPSKQEEDQEENHHSWELPAIEIPGQPKAELREEDKVGSYGQPRWTAHRRFGETRVYVIPEGQMEFEYWVVPEIPRHGDTETKTQYEFEFGLPYRFQLDLYMVSHQDGNEGALEFDQLKTEIRWAFANWGEIWGNPTAYLEWKAKNDSPDAIEAKLLFGGEICPRWHWGVNFVYEQETGGARETGREITGGLSYTCLDEKLSVGVESKFVYTNNDDDGRGALTSSYQLGPSIQFKPLKRAHIDIAPLFGLDKDAPKCELILIFGWEF